MNKELGQFLKTIIWDGFVVKAGPYFIGLLIFMFLVEIGFEYIKNKQNKKNDTNKEK